MLLQSILVKYDWGIPENGVMGCMMPAEQISEREPSEENGIKNYSPIYLDEPCVPFNDI